MNNFKKSKKGFLLAEETLKMIIAVICIVFLVYILVAIYNSHTSDKKISQAREAFFGKEGGVPGIENITLSLKEGESDDKDIIDPQGWHLYSFVETEKPDLCLNQRCLCICEQASIKLFKSQTKKCDEKGACLVMSNLAATKIDFKINGANDALFIKIKKQDGKIFVERAR